MQTNGQKGASAALIVGIIAIIAVLAGAGFFLLTPQQQTPGTENMMQNENTMNQSGVPNGEETGAYRDGTYNAEGNYVSPGGPESIGVTITLTDGMVTDATVVAKAERPMSKKMQDQFISGYKEQVIGKNIDEIELTKVSGSSLTPKGFNDALEEIKTQAQA